MKALEAMNAANAALQNLRAAEQRAHEPSMEEILASIRKIIADDQALPIMRSRNTVPETPPEPAPVVQQPSREEPRFEDVSRWQMRDTREESEAPRAPEPAPAPVLRAIPSSSANVPPPPAWALAPPPAANVSEELDDEPLVSPDTDASVSSAFGALAAARLMPSSEDMDEMAREMLRPMLKAWLDDNLPVMVERLVRAEIERVARGGR